LQTFILYERQLTPVYAGGARIRCFDLIKNPGEGRGARGKGRWVRASGEERTDVHLKRPLTPPPPKLLKAIKQWQL